MGMCTLCFVHAVIEVRIAANSTKDPLVPSTRFAGSCPAIRVAGESEVHTFLFDVVLTYTGRYEVRGGGGGARARLECLAEAFGLIDEDGEEIPEDKLEELFGRVRLLAAVPYLEALEDLLRKKLDAVTAGVGADGFVADDQYAFYRPVQQWQRVNLPSQYAVQARTEEVRRRSVALHAGYCVDGRRVGRPTRCPSHPSFAAGRPGPDRCPDGETRGGPPLVLGGRQRAR